jgi:hypothetical protein
MLIYGSSLDSAGAHFSKEIVRKLRFPNNSIISFQSTNPAAERTGYDCKVFDSGYMPLVPPQGSSAQAGSWVCTLRNESIFQYPEKVCLVHHLHGQKQTG